jgi:hypothetical protein
LVQTDDGTVSLSNRLSISMLANRL